jgi:hypothetical protein
MKHVVDVIVKDPVVALRDHNEAADQLVAWAE